MALGVLCVERLACRCHNVPPTRLFNTLFICGLSCCQKPFGRPTPKLKAKVLCKRDENVRPRGTYHAPPSYITELRVICGRAAAERCIPSRVHLYTQHVAVGSFSDLAASCRTVQLSLYLQLLIFSMLDLYKM